MHMWRFTLNAAKKARDNVGQEIIFFDCGLPFLYVQGC